MFHTYLQMPATDPREFSELKRDDLVLAIESARVEGYHSTEKALIELLSVLDDILGVGGQINYRVNARERAQ